MKGDGICLALHTTLIMTTDRLTARAIGRAARLRAAVSSKVDRCRDAIELAEDETQDYRFGCDYYFNSAVELFLRSYTELDACAADPRDAERWTRHAI